MYKDTIPIFFAVDDSYAPFLGVALRSIIDNASKEYKYKIIVINDGLNETNIRKLSAMKTENFSVEFVAMQQLSAESFTNKSDNRLHYDYFTLTIFYRLFIADMFPEYDKGIYIDSDIIVPGDISELYNIDLKDNLIGGCVDISVAEFDEIQNYYKNAVGVRGDEYINSGVLLMNLKELRKVKFAEKFMDLLHNYKFDVIAPDQDYINAMCKGRILHIDNRWDSMPAPGLAQPFENPKLIHYNLFQKPWHYDGVGYEDYFWSYADKTEFSKEIHDIKDNYSDTEKENDDKNFKVLVQRAVDVPKTDKCFVYAIKNGAKITV
ncbi:MAG: glycosyltransferase family 8 protein [Eubacteriales bacterium]|nr:glycosyltransferase family 8 protein [Eubacteriales bacterium]